jgi:hypothetical protein
MNVSAANCDGSRHMCMRMLLLLLLLLLPGVPPQVQ